MKKVNLWQGGMVGKFKPATNIAIVVSLALAYGFVKYFFPESTDAGVLLGALLAFIKHEN